MSWMRSRTRTIGSVAALRKRPLAPNSIRIRVPITIAIELFYQKELATKRSLLCVGARALGGARRGGHAHPRAEWPVDRFAYEMRMSQGNERLWKRERERE